MHIPRAELTLCLQKVVHGTVQSNMSKNHGAESFLSGMRAISSFLGPRDEVRGVNSY